MYYHYVAEVVGDLFSLSLVHTRTLDIYMFSLVLLPPLAAIIATLT